MMLTARIKSCAAAVCVLAGCLLLPNAQAKAESISLPERTETDQAQSAPAAKSAQAETAVVTPLALETVALPAKEEAVTEEPLAEEASVTEAAPEEAAEEAPAPEADNAIARATKADHERPDDLVKLGDFIATAYCVTGQTTAKYEGYDWVTFKYQGEEYWTALLGDRNRLEKCECNCN